jgi:hypothetical protein
MHVLFDPKTSERKPGSLETNMVKILESSGNRYEMTDSRSRSRSRSRKKKKQKMLKKPPKSTSKCKKYKAEIIGFDKDGFGKAEDVNDPKKKWIFFEENVVLGDFNELRKRDIIRVVAHEKSHEASKEWLIQPRD